jgi:hypothetical protein
VAKRNRAGRGHVAATLAVGVMVTLVILALSVLAATLDPAQQLTAEYTSLLSAVAGGVVGALAVYLGQEPPNGGDDEPTKGDEP